VQIGKIYDGRVTSIKDFGAFVEILPGRDGLCHISELSTGYVSSVRRLPRRRRDEGARDRRRRARPREAQPQVGLYEKSEGIWLLITFYLLLCVTVSSALALRLRRDSPATPRSPRGRAQAKPARILVLALAIPLGCLLWELAWGRLASAGTLKEIAFQAIPLLLLGAAVCAMRLICRAAWWPSAGSSRRLRVGFAIALSILVAMPASWLYWQMLRPTPLPLVTYEEPNHYDRIVAITEQLGDPPAAGARHPLLDEAVVLLQAPNHIPLEVVEASMRAPRSGPPMVYRQLWPITEHLRQAAESAANARQPDRGADDAIAILRLSSMLQRGGRSDEAAEGQRLNWSGFRFLAAHRGSFSPAKARETIAALQRLLDERDDPATLAARDLVHTARTRGWREKLRSTLALLRGKHRPNAPQFDDQRRRDEAVNLLLQADLAIRLYREDTGKLPSRLAELVPAYLPAVPLDPYDKQPLRYRVEGDRFVLYSIGSDGTDNGGRSAANTLSSRTQPSGYDLNLAAVAP
jgi:hypothetical protein